jgi:hypothetical protein
MFFPLRVGFGIIYSGYVGFDCNGLYIFSLLWLAFVVPRAANASKFPLVVEYSEGIIQELVYSPSRLG